MQKGAGQAPRVALRRRRRKAAETSQRPRLAIQAGDGRTDLAYRHRTAGPPPPVDVALHRRGRGDDHLVGRQDRAHALPSLKRSGRTASFRSSPHPFTLSEVEACPERLPWQAVEGGTRSSSQSASTSLSTNGQLRRLDSIHGNRHRAKRARHSRAAPLLLPIAEDHSAAATSLAGRVSRRSAMRADLPVRPRR